MDLKSIGKYTIVEKIGQGAMGEVYKALDPVLNRHVAIKTMTAAIGNDPELRKRFLREAQSAARLAHPNIVTLYDFGEDQGRVYMAMELLQGADLKDLIKQKTLTLQAKLDLMEQVCDALAAAHAMDVVHRDIKPANIHVQPNGQVKIVDFGLARLGSSEMTKTGMVMGTPHYMSPEQVRGERADVRSDIFSLGGVFYELLGNHKPFDADSLHAVFFQVLEHEPPPVRQWEPELPEVLVPFLAKALAKDPAQRYQNAGEMRQALRLVRQAWLGELAEAEAIAILSGSAPSAGATWTPNVQGTSALAPERRPAARAAQSGTLPGAAATSSGSQAVAAASSRWPLIGGAVGVAALAAILTFVWDNRRSAAPAAPEGPSGVEVVTRQLVLTKLQLAQTKLEVKDFRGAVLEAEQVLELDRSNTEAQRIREQVRATFAELDQAAGQARSAVKAGDLETASTALQKVMSIDPQHPVAAELSKQLDSRFRERADEARQAMKRSQGGAEQANAVSQRSYVEAVAAGREAEVLFGRGDFTLAAQKFLDSRDNFERARRAALEKLPASAGPVPVYTAAPRPAPTPYVAAASPGPVAAPTALPTAAAPTQASGDEQGAVLRVIADYERAIESKDLGLYRRIWPTLSAGEEKKLQAAFSQVQDHDVRIKVDSVDVSGGTATVRLARNDTMKGRPVGARTQTVSLVKQGEAWTIRAIQ